MACNQKWNEDDYIDIPSACFNSRNRVEIPNKRIAIDAIKHQAN
jgi:hypothetical protein